MSHPSPVRLAVPARGALTLAAGLLLTGAVLAGCAGGSKGSAGAGGGQTTAAARQSQGQGSGFGGGAGGPAASGTIAEIDGSTVQVQNPASGQVAVNYSTGTTFSQTETVKLSALKVGDCVTAIGQRGQGSTSPSASASARPTSFPAQSVQISTPVNGSCAAAGGRGNFPGARPSGSFSRPSGAPSSRPSGFNRGGGGFGFGDFATGTVSSLTADSMVVQTPARGQQSASTTTVTLTTGTTYTETVPATATALKVGECLSATGKSDTTGAVAATRIELSPASANGCTLGGGFGRRPGASASPAGS